MSCCERIRCTRWEGGIHRSSVWHWKGIRFWAGETRRELKEMSRWWDKKQHSGLWAQPLPAAHNYDNGPLSLVKLTCSQLLLSYPLFFYSRAASLVFISFVLQFPFASPFNTRARGQLGSQLLSLTLYPGKTARAAILSRETKVVCGDFYCPPPLCLNRVRKTSKC